MTVKLTTLSRVALFCGLCCIVAGLMLVKPPGPTMAQDDEPATDLDPSDPGYCIVCHTDTDQTFQLADGSIHNVGVDLDTLNASAHGAGSADGPLACADCHTQLEFPHEGPLPESDRLYTVSRSLGCIDCHTEETENLGDGVHYTALLEGNLRSATCVDCHGAHDVTKIDDAPVWATTSACGDCHTTTFNEYKDSVHGVALFEGDENLPACTDCHGVHGIDHPTTALFRNRSPETCAVCHADKDLMADYGISTNIFDSYLTDFHGSTVALFNQTASDVPTNKAVCYDCHGVHDITPSDDDKSRVVRENLVQTCQNCHPDATSDFPDSWVGHFEPTIESHPLMFAVDWFYKLLIPFTLGAFAVLIGTDIIRIIRERLGLGRRRD